MKRKGNKFVNQALFFIGLAIVLLSGLPYLILGENAAIPYHDQLDGELIAYMYQAKYLFSGQNVIPEFLNGAAKTALMPPASLAVLLFRIVPPFTALVLLQTLGQVIAYIGMFRLTERLTEGLLQGTMYRKVCAFVAAISYAFLPFLAVYGLSQYGMPLLLLCIYHIYKKEHVKRSFLYIIFYASMSSLVLCGFACLGIWAVGLLVLAVRKQLGKHKTLITGFLVMLTVYLLENILLIGQILGIGGGGVSHKSEYVLAGGDIVSSFRKYLIDGTEHSADHHLWILCLTAVMLLFIFAAYKKLGAGIQKAGKYLLGNLGIICVLCLAAALWNCNLGVALRGHLGALGAFQIERVVWLTPMLWQIEFAVCLAVLGNLRSYLKWVGYGASAVLICGATYLTLRYSSVKPCLQQILQSDYDVITYSDYLAVGVMNQAEAFLEEREGLRKNEYKVASLGIDPAAALYHGFYCVDGYSNNYDLAYKHAFREVIAPELEQSAYLLEYYDNWGNRCYLLSAECPGYYTIEKNGFFYSNLQINTEALRKLGCDYILSAAYVVNAEEEKLLLLNEEAFETQDSYYRIFVYKIML